MDNEKELSKQVELENCTFVKTVLMILVVFYHSILFWGGGWFTNNPVGSSFALPQISKWMNSFHIYGFTLVSGYLFFYLKCEKDKYKKFIPFVANKAKRLLIPYVFVAVVWVIPIQYLFFEYDIATVINKYVFATAPNQLWFLLMLFVVFTIFWLLSNFFEKHTFLGGAVAIGFYGLSLVGGRVIPNIFQIWTACAYIPFFWLGFKIRQYGSGNLRKIHSLVWIIGDVALFVLTRYLSAFDFGIFKLLNFGFSFVLHMVGAMMAFVVLQKIANRINWNNRYFDFWSSRSMTIYLFHQQVIYFFIYGLNGVVNPYINAIVNFIGAMVVSLVISTVLMKFKWMRFLIGG